MKGWLRQAERLSGPPLETAALLWDRWEMDPPFNRESWLGNLLIVAFLPARGLTMTHLFGLNIGLREVDRSLRRSSDQATRLKAFFLAVSKGAAEGARRHVRLLGAKRLFDRKLAKCRKISSLPKLAGLVMAPPIVSLAILDVGPDCFFVSPDC